MSSKVAGWDEAIRLRGKRKMANLYTSMYPARSYRKTTGSYGSLTAGNHHVDPVYPKPEVKYVDKDQTGVAFTVTPTASPMTSAGTTIMLNSIAPGATAGQRLGQQVSIRNCTYRYNLSLPSIPANQVATSGRVMIVWDRQPNGAPAAFTDIFVGANYLAYMLPGSAQRFVILRNDQYSLSPNGTQIVFNEGHISINMLTTFPGAANIPISGALLLVFISDQGTLANQPTIAGCFRTRYMDN